MTLRPKTFGFLITEIVVIGATFLLLVPPLVLWISALVYSYMRHR
jgi:hypothetical protein